MAKSNAVLVPTLGLYLDRPSLAVPSRGLVDGLNFRVRDGKLSNLNLGTTRFGTFVLNGPVRMIADFFPTGLGEKLVFGTPTDLYEYVAASQTVRFLTPRYATGTAAASGTAVTGTATNWLAAGLNIKAGDQISFGSASQRDPNATWFTISGAPGSGTSITLTTSAGSISNGAYTIRRRFSGSATTVWSYATFLRSDTGEDQLWMTNGLDNIVKWNGNDTMVNDEFGGLVMGFKASVVFNYSNMLIFGNLIQSGTLKPTDIVNSDVGKPAVFTGGLSEQFKVHSGSSRSGLDPLSGMEQLGDNLVIYSGRHVVLAQFVGDPLVFVFRTISSDIGPIAGKAVANFGDFHAFIGNDTQYRFDGVSIKESNVHVWREILRTQDPVRINGTYSHFNEENAELFWVVPLTIDPSAGQATSPPSRSYVEHYLEPVGQGVPTPYSARSFTFTATGYYSQQAALTWDQLTQQWNQLNFRWNDQFFFSAFPLSLGGTSDGKIYTFNSSQNADGTALPSFVRFGRRPTMDGVGRGLIARVYPFVTQFANNLLVTLRLSDHASGPNTTTQTDTFDQSLPEGGHFTTPYRRARFVEVEFGTAGPNQPWELGGYDIEVRPGGRR